MKYGGGSKITYDRLHFIYSVVYETKVPWKSDTSDGTSFEIHTCKGTHVP